MRRIPLPFRVPLQEHGFDLPSRVPVIDSNEYVLLHDTILLISYTARRVAECCFGCVVKTPK